MKKYHISEVCFLACIGLLAFTTNAWLYESSTTSKPKPKTVCLDNQNADGFIRGDGSNAVNNFLKVIRDIGVFVVIGDREHTPTGCRKAINDNKLRKQHLYNGISWTIDCWEPSECTMIEEVRNGYHFFNLLPVSSSTSASNKVRTILLPLVALETSSYTFLPSTTQRNIFFVTTMLSGCSFFVAKPNKIDCNLIVIHTNFHCNDTSENGTDYNHLQAMAVLEEIQSTNSLCTYKIERRWATAYWRPAIEAAAGYDYAGKIFYYYDLESSFLYGNHLGGNSGKWQFCIKLVVPNSPPPTCYFI